MRSVVRLESNMKALFTIVVLISIMPVQFSMAAESPCEGAVTTREMEQCLKHELSRSEEEIEKYLKEAQRLTTGKSLDKLNAVQGQWELYKNMQCEAVYQQNIDGSWRDVQLLSCKSEKNKQRTLELWQVYIENLDSTLQEPK
jgi:uncharacterized protein YecT (DUF1311 family)